LNGVFSTSQSFHRFEWIHYIHRDMLVYSCFSSKRFMSFCQLTMSRMTKPHSGFDTQPSSWSGTFGVNLCSSTTLVTDRLIYRALKPPGWQREWHIGVRVSSNRKLVAFISGVPIHLRVRQK
jgi:hypothetical protein